MKKIEVFDPSLCCSTGVCGVEVDQALVTFAADVDWAKQNGAHIERYNLAQQPQMFADNATVKGFLQRSGQDALPLILVDGEGTLLLAGARDHIYLRTTGGRRCRLRSTANNSSRPSATTG